MRLTAGQQEWADKVIARAAGDAEVLRQLVLALIQAESALSIQGSYRAHEQGQIERARQVAKDALNP